MTLVHMHQSLAPLRTAKNDRHEGMDLKQETGVFSVVAQGVQTIMPSVVTTEIPPAHAHFHRTEVPVRGLGQR